MFRRASINSKVDILPFIAFAVFIPVKFILADLSNDVGGGYTDAYYSGQAIVYVLMFAFARYKITGRYKHWVSGILGVLVSELISQIFYCGCHTWLDASLYTILPIVGYMYSKKVLK